MVDIHCHILQQMDDGARDLQTALAMCRTAEQNGYDALILTPHHRRLFAVQEFLEKRQAQYTILKQACKEAGLKLELYLGAEVLLSEDILFEPDLKPAALNGSRYLLVEFPYEGTTKTSVLKYMDAIRAQELVPVLAHPERYPLLQKDYTFINVLADKGVLFQNNILPLAGQSTQREFRLAKEMVNHGFCAFLATDSHNLTNRHNRVIPLIEQMPQEVAREKFRMQFEENGWRIIRNEAIPEQEQRPMERHRFW